MSEKELREREDIIRVAKDLNYNKNTIEKLRNAKTIIEMENIMIDARRGMN